uniref:Uncharacterized protein n=1 Tax=Chlamydomonas leiostraca TaxID=1034604 RepID=A0A7S0RCC8_9CHLO|mmetsp:Transcript_18640/g.47240  ORF Transcript_18640/g.47240 Transcript_18640/m.47240 type:complete len:136 (+) Transcript_18640:129-536(+)|eukprot:CAMPEP_0202860456 /NCGR_PEP_ID=MMETSP1391-20130828/2150_1 /ASSEMBLY_ACC=CAM_ASM_000867 /TAXON_ID=1034604 /ORGANISM="Chlamydomonas leiostraca, Strain SAG 11-49" /LENGTH=135 /DNA_ID=CAMNT_0049539619 /DNA_START=53 /DNA_END=460 /DNA_ORIENTATION=+
MADPTALKDQGNAHFQAGEWLKAAAMYTQAIKAKGESDPESAVLFSNRSAALLKLKKVTKALEDAEQCIKLRPEWEKGYFRKGAVLEDLENFSEALEVYQHALTIVSDSKELSVKIRTIAKLAKKDTKSKAEKAG